MSLASYRRGVFRETYFPEADNLPTEFGRVVFRRIAPSVGFSPRSVPPAVVASDDLPFYSEVNRDGSGNIIDWSTVTAGTPMYDGFFVGIMDVPPDGFPSSINGRWALIVSNKSREVTASIWSSAASPGFSGIANSGSFTHGQRNTANQSASTLPAANAAASYGGFGSAPNVTEWYIPSQQELDLCYRVLKPTTTANVTDARTILSDPPYGGITPSDPVQTTVTGFASGEAQEFDADLYATSTITVISGGPTTSTLRSISFSDGELDLEIVPSSAYTSAAVLVRPVRRVWLGRPDKATVTTVVLGQATWQASNLRWRFDVLVDDGD